METEAVKRRIITATVLVVLTPAEEGGYTVTMPAFPGCVTEGETVEDALANAKQAANLWCTSQQPPMVPLNRHLGRST